MRFNAFFFNTLCLPETALRPPELFDVEALICGTGESG